MIEVIRYTPGLKKDWDNFISNAKNGTFLFYRDYMEYHADRFEDFSCMLYDNGKLKSVFPCNRNNDLAYSHQGLTFGGIIIQYKTTSLTYLEYFNLYNNFFKEQGINRVIYKTIPQVYKSYFGDEEEYAMFRINAEKIGSYLSSCIDLSKKISITRNRKRNLQKSKEQNITTCISNDWNIFWDIMYKNMMEKFSTKPVHTVEEILSLKKFFPNNIELLGAYKDNNLIAGAVIFKYQNVIKIQYAHSSPIGKEYGAIDNIYNHIILNLSKTYQYMDIGHSNLNNGTYINTGLINQKESFGARGINYNIYEYKTNQNIQ